MISVNETIKKILICPVCGGDELSYGENTIRCENCGERYDLIRNVPVMIPRGGKKELHKNIFGAPYGISAWNKKIRELMPDGKGIALDFGCGANNGEAIINKGYEYIGYDQDIFSDHTGLVGNGEDIPIKDEALDLVTSVRVIEHLPDPFRTNREIYRIIKKGGVYIGSAAFLESFHANSYFHMTHKGLRHLLETSGFTVIHMENDSAGSNYRNGIEGLIAEEFYWPHSLRPLNLDPLRPVSWGIGTLAGAGFMMRRFAWKILLNIVRDPGKKELVRRNLKEEKYWFARGFRFLAVKE